LGFNQSIIIGWYKDNQLIGNYMKLNGSSLAIIEKGFHYNNTRISDMKDDKVYKKFQRQNIFLE